MDGKLERLAQVLQQLLDLNRELLAVCENKRRALATMDLDGLQETMRQEESLAGRVASLEQVRRELVEELMPDATGARRPARDTLLSHIIERTAEPARTRLAGLRRELINVLSRLKEANTTNQVVSRRSIRHFRDMLGLMSGVGRADERYRRDGSLRREELPSALVDQIA